MRITNSMMINSFMSNLNRNMTLMGTYQDQLSSGKRINRLSDDPIGVMSALDARAKLAKLAQHNSSIDDGKSWLDQTDISLQELSTMMVELNGNTVGAANGTLSDSDRKAIGALVGQMKDHIVQVSNTTYGGRYIFGGYNTTAEPFKVDATGNLLYNGVNLADPLTPAATITALQNQVIRYSTGTNITTDISVNGVQLMGTGANNLYDVLNKLQIALNTGSAPTVISGFIGQLQTKQQDILALVADVGGRQNRLDIMSSSNADNEVNYTAELSRVEDVDQAMATMEFKMAEAVYRSALSVGAKVIQPTLLDFLR